MAKRQTETSDIIAAYQQTRSVWKAGKLLGISGQNVHKRLVAAGYKVGNANWTEEEDKELLHLLQEGGLTAHQAAERLGRTFAGVACRLRRLNVRSYKKKREPKIPRGAGYDKASTLKHIKILLDTPEIKATSYVRSVGLEINAFTGALKKHCPELYEQYLSKHYGEIERKDCAYCGVDFIPANKRQVYCSPKCANERRQDDSYYGGKRRSAIGFAEQQCQLCLKTTSSLQVHHIIGKKNDQDDKYLVALCKGCHRLVGIAAHSKLLINSAEAWERLIQFSWLEANGHKVTDGTEIYTSVDIDFYKSDDND